MADALGPWPENVISFRTADWDAFEAVSSAVREHDLWLSQRSVLAGAERLPLHMSGPPTLTSDRSDPLVRNCPGDGEQ